jgi:hypothetical protein
MKLEIETYYDIGDKIGNQEVTAIEVYLDVALKEPYLVRYLVGPYWYNTEQLKGFTDE